MTNEVPTLLQEEIIASLDRPGGYLEVVLGRSHLSGAPSFLLRAVIDGKPAGRIYIPTRLLDEVIYALCASRARAVERYGAGAASRPGQPWGSYAPPREVAHLDERVAGAAAGGAAR
jgi:hypothetical protein